MTQQFTVRLACGTDSLANLVGLLARREVDIRSVSVGSLSEAGCLAVIITNNDGATRDVLHSHHYAFAEGESVVVSIEDRPGSLARATRVLADAGVELTSVLVLQRHQGRAELSLTVSDAVAARRALGSNKALPAL